MTRDELRREYIADELRAYREEHRRLEAEQRDLEEQLVRAKNDRKELEEHLVALLLNGREAGLEVQKMARWAGVHRNKTHRVTRHRQLRSDEMWTGTATTWTGSATTNLAGLTEAVAHELVPLLDNPQALREAWVVAFQKYGPSPTAAQTREVVSLAVALGIGRSVVGGARSA